MSTPVGPYSPTVRVGDVIYTAGQVGIRDGKLVDGGFSAQLDQAMANLAAVLAGEGASLADVVKTTVFLTSMDDYAALNDGYLAAMGDNRPARSAVAVAELPIGALVEIEAIAHLPLT